MPPEICPVCGAEVPPKARACPDCGADEETGWSERAEAQRLGLPDDEFDYDEFVKEELGGGKREVRPRGIALMWWVVAIVLLIVTVLYLLRAAL